MIKSNKSGMSLQQMSKSTSDMTDADRKKMSRNNTDEDKKHLKAINAPKHWALDKLGGI
jgi:hypothetical protein